MQLEILRFVTVQNKNSRVRVFVGQKLRQHFILSGTIPPACSLIYAALHSVRGQIIPVCIGAFGADRHMIRT